MPGSPGKAGAALHGGSPAVEDSSSGAALATLACPAGAATASAAAVDMAAEEGGISGSEGGTTWQTVRLIWAPMAALSLSSTVALTLFPFFTYVPTSGLLGESLPKVRWQAVGVVRWTGIQPTAGACSGGAVMCCAALRCALPRCALQCWTAGWAPGILRILIFATIS